MTHPDLEIDSRDMNHDWVLSLQLTTCEIILNNKKINSQDMEDINTIAKLQFPEISGFQLTEKVPVYLNKEK